MRLLFVFLRLLDLRWLVEVLLVLLLALLLELLPVVELAADMVS